MRGVLQFNGERLTQARLARGLTQASLSAVTGYSRASISKWEKGDQYPEAIAIPGIATALGVTEHWLMSEPLQIKRNPFYFRSNASITKQVRSIASIRLEWAYEISNIIQEWVDLPRVNLPQTLSREEALLINDEDIERVALECRKLWGLNDNPVSNITRVVESAGVIVVREESGYSNMDGVSTWFDPENRPYIWLSADKESGVRSRFDLAHELGHLIMHKNLLPEDQNKPQSYNEIERQADLFAAAFLMPASTISTSLRVVTLDSLLMAKKRWGASVAALIMRAHKLDFISDEHKTRLFRNYSYRGWKTNEPFDNDMTVEQPSLLSKAIRLLLDEGNFTRKDLIEKTGYSAADIESLCGLSNGFMKENYSHEVQMRRDNLRILA